MIIDVNMFEGSWEELGIMYADLYASIILDAHEETNHTSSLNSAFGVTNSQTVPVYYNDFARGFWESIDEHHGQPKPVFRTSPKHSCEVVSYGEFLAVRYQGPDLTITYGELCSKPFMFAGPINSWPGSMAGMGRQGLCYCDPHPLPNPSGSTAARLHSVYLSDFDAFLGLILDTKRPVAIAAPKGYFRQIKELPYVRHKGVPTNEESARRWFDDSVEGEVLFMFDASKRELTVVRGQTYEEVTYALEDF